MFTPEPVHCYYVIVVSHVCRSHCGLLRRGCDTYGVRITLSNTAEDKLVCPHLCSLCEGEDFTIAAIPAAVWSPLATWTLQAVCVYARVTVVRPA